MDKQLEEPGSKILEIRRDDASPVSQDGFPVTIDEMTDAIITTDGHGGVVYLNQAAQSLTGWSQVEAAGLAVEAVFRIVHGETHLSIECPAIRALREGVVVGLPEGSLIVTKDGTDRPIDDSGAPVRGALPILDAQGMVTGAALVFGDLAERRWRDVEAQDALAYAGMVIANLPIPLGILGADLEILTANDPFYETFQTTEGEAEGRSFRAIGGGEWDTDRLEAWIEGVASGEHDGGNFDVEYDWPSTGRKSLTLNGRRMTPRSDRPGLILVSIEHTIREGRPSTQVMRSEERYRRLFETAKDGILILDAVEARVIDANPFMLELLGRSLDELLGKELWEMGLFSDIAANQLAVKKLLADGYIRYEHLPIVSREDAKVEVEFVSNVYPEGDSNVIQCNIRDITERRNLERLAAQQAQKVALANRRKDEFLAMLSHELRNPLGAILNSVQIFRLRGEEDAAQRQAREILERQVGHLRHLVDDLLEVSRITSGNFNLHLLRCDARTVIDRSIESIVPLIDQLRHQLTASIPPDPIWLVADPARLEQVVVNLLTNAAKYTDSPGRIALELRRDGTEVVIRVSDSGIGISPELLPHVFELFTQADRSLERSQGGLGVGLTLVERIVTLHRGTVEARSAGLGQGSEFVIRLPADAASAEPASAEPASTVSGSPSVRVLVVDDNVDYADGIALLLRASGYDVKVVHNGPDALSSAIGSRPDVIVLDIGLPGMDGYEVARRIRLETGLEDMRIVAVSGYRQEQGKSNDGKARFDEYLLKPVLVDDLKAHLLPA